MKKCTLCKKEKENSGFYKCKTRRDGLNTRCKKCISIITILHYHKNKERILRLSKERYNNNKEYYIKKAIKRKKLFPEQIKANKAVHRATVSGKLKRLPCEVCGKKETEGHHESYKKEDWLNVRWLCREHHMKEHRKWKDKDLIIV